MSSKIKRLVAGAAAVALAGVGLVATSGSASALSTPAYEPDPNSIGYISFYNAAGQQITGGNNLAHIADYLKVSTPGRTGATKATLLFANPDHTKITSLWGTASASASTNFPNAAAPAPLNTATNPVVTLGATDANLSSFLASAILDTTAGYQNYIQIRVKDSGAGLAAATTYWTADISFNIAAGTWAVEYPAAAYPTAATTATSLTATPVSGANNEQNVFFTAAVSGNTLPGTVTFKSDGTQIGAVKNVPAGGGSVNSDTTLLSAAAAPGHHITADFTPGAPGFTAGDLASSGSLNYVVTQVTHTTQTVVTPSAASFAQPSAVTATATVTDDASANVTAGTVQFQVDGANVGSPVSYVGGTTNGFPFTASSSGLSVASHTIVAVFTAASNPSHQLAGSTSPSATFAVTAASYKDDLQAIETVINPGTITISTPYSGDNGTCGVYTDTTKEPVKSDATLLGKLYVKTVGSTDGLPGTVIPTVAGQQDSHSCGFLFIPAMALNGNATEYATSGTFDGISVTDTRPGDNSFTLSALASQLTKQNGGGTPDEIINAQNIGLTHLEFNGTNALAPYNSFSGTPGAAIGTLAQVQAGTAPNFTPFDNPAASHVASGASGSLGLGGSTPHSILHAVRGLGTSQVQGTLAINAPTNTRDGVYTGTVDFTVIGS